MAKNYLSLKSKIIEFRGTIIEEICMLEHAIDFYIAGYFCSDPYKRSELMTVFLKTNRTNLEAKRQIFEYLLKTNYPQEYKQNPTLMKDLVYLVETRNVIAHYLMDFSDNAVENQYEFIAFTKYKNTKTQIAFKPNDIIELKEKIKKCSNIIGGFTNKFWLKEISTPPSN